MPVTTDLHTTEQAESIFQTVTENSQLKTLDISNNKLYRVEPGLLTKAVNKLKTLNISYTRLRTWQTKSVFQNLINNSQLKSLDISNNKLSSLEPDLLAKAIKHLETLNIMSTALTPQQTNSIISSIAKDSQVKSLNMSFNNLSLVNVSLLTRAVNRQESLKMRETSLTTHQTESILATISEGSKLKSLDISFIDLSSVDPVLLARAVSKLDSFNVKGTSLTTEQVQSILADNSKVSQLKNLNISYNNLSSVDPVTLARAVNSLETLDMKSTSLRTQQAESIFGAIVESSQLKTLNMSHNNLSSVNPELLSRAANELDTLILKKTSLTRQQQEFILPENFQTQYS